MGEFRRNVGDFLNIKHIATPVNLGENLFVRARVLQKDGTELAELSLTEIDSGLYSENAYQMPNLDQVIVKYKVFNDAGFTSPVYEFPEETDIYELDVFDPSVLRPEPNQVEAKVENKNIEAILDNSDEINVEIGNSQEISAVVISGDELIGKIKNNQEIEGEVND